MIDWEIDTITSHNYQGILVLPALKARGKTVLVISHDDRYFYLADRCIKLEEGRIVAEEKPVTVGKQTQIT